MNSLFPGTKNAPRAAHPRYAGMKWRQVLVQRRETIRSCNSASLTLRKATIRRAGIPQDSAGHRLHRSGRFRLSLEARLLLLLREPGEERHEVFGMLLLLLQNLLDQAP